VRRSFGQSQSVRSVVVSPLVGGGGASGGTVRVEKEEETADERPEAVWKEFLHSLAPLMTESVSGGGGVVVCIERQGLFALIGSAAGSLSVMYVCA